MIITFDDGHVVNLGVVAASLHQHNYVCESVPATCTEDGYYRFVCNECGHTETVINKAQGHIFEAYREKVAPTCASEGVKSRKCSVCGYEETITIPAHDHSFSSKCVFDANKHWRYCTICGVTAEAEEHVFVDNKCTVCSYSQPSATYSGGLIFGLNDDGESYALIGLGTCEDKNIDIPASYNGYPVTRIVTDAFKNTDIVSVTMPDTIKQIGRRAFYNCNSLTSVVLSNSLKELSSECFYSSRALTSIVIPEGVERIPNYAFAYCSSLESVVLPETVTMLDYGCFNECRSLTSIVIPNSVLRVCSNAFSWCTSLNNIVVPSSTYEIGSSAFAYCTSLTSVSLSYGLKEIGSEAFYSCYQLQSVIIPSSVCSIGSNCFSNCQALTSVIFEQTDGWYSDSGDNVYKEVLEVPELAARQVSSSGWYWYCRLIARYVYAAGAIILDNNESKTVHTSLSPETATSTITFTSLDESIVSVDENGVVTAVGNGMTKIKVESAGATSLVDVFVGETIVSLKGAAFDNFESSNTPYELNVAGYTWLNDGRLYRGYWNDAYVVWAQGTTFKNVSEINGVSKVVIQYYTEYTNDYSCVYDRCALSAGNSEDNMIIIPCDQTSTVKADETDDAHYSGNNAGIYTATYTIPAGCKYFNFNFGYWGNVANISFY